MRKTRLILFLLLSLSLPYARAVHFLNPSVKGAGNCWQAFKKPFNPKKNISAKWPNLANPKSPLLEDTKKKILSHPRVKELRVSYKSGRGLTFDFSYIGPTAPHKGEHIQQAFLIEVIKMIFPNAKIVKRSYNTRFDSLYPFNQSSKVHVSLKVSDIWEYMKFMTEQDFERYLSIHKNIVDMVLLKRANSSQKGISDEYKKSFPDFEKKSVLSLYLPEKYLNYKHEDLQKESLDLFQILDNFLALGFRKVFLTSHFNTRLSIDQMNRFLSALSNHFDKILFLSQLSHKELFQIQDQDKVIFFNDLTGYTPVLHSLADIAFIFGPVNMLEGLFLDAKVVFMNKEYSTNRTYRIAFDQLKQTALKTNRAVYIESLDELEEALHTLDRLSLEPTIYPDEVKIHSSKGSALDQLIERLYFQITENALLSNNRFIEPL